MHVDQFRQIVEHAQDVIVVTEARPLDEPGPRIIYVNPAFTRLTGYTSDEVIGQSPRLLQRPSTVDATTRGDIRAGLESGEGFRGPILNFSKDGTAYWLDMNIFALRDDTGHITAFAAIERDITARMLRESELRSAARTDALTGLFNRRALTQVVAGIWDDTALNSVLVLDLDRFKAVNDQHGHTTGDQILQSIGDVLATVARDGDYPIRSGGDEFLLVLMHTDLPAATRIATQVQDELAYAQIGRDLPPVTVSIGAASGHMPLTEMIDSADRALRRSKRAGRNLITS